MRIHDKAFLEALSNVGKPKVAAVVEDAQDDQGDKFFEDSKGSHWEGIRDYANDRANENW